MDVFWESELSCIFGIQSVEDHCLSVAVCLFCFCLSIFSVCWLLLLSVSLLEHWSAFHLCGNFWWPNVFAVLRGRLAFGCFNSLVRLLFIDPAFFKVTLFFAWAMGLHHWGRRPHCYSQLGSISSRQKIANLATRELAMRSCRHVGRTMSKRQDRQGTLTRSILDSVLQVYCRANVKQVLFDKARKRESRYISNWSKRQTSINFKVRMWGQQTARDLTKFNLK